MVQNFSLPYNKDQFLGGEAALWTEQVSDFHLKSKILQFQFN